MAACTQCNVCERPTTWTDAVEVGEVPCNVRKFRDRSFTLWRCGGCRSLHCLEDADLARFYEDYPLQRQQITFSERIGYRNRLRLLERQGVLRTDRVLDYGCGAGLYVEFLRQNGFTSAHGYDPFVAEYADPTALESEYDAVVTFDVIEHDENPRAFLGSMRRLMRARAILMVGTPNADHVSPARRGDPNLHVPYHRHILSEGALLALAAEQGMRPVDIYRRSFYDSLFPTVNSRFMWRYIREKEGLLDAAVEPPDVRLVMRSPRMILLALGGYFVPRRDNIVVTFAL
jgi:2-polyprenyl-3-methyl-5-hydroxy-6-metoxy-1,4-benzoquinol methylase